MRIKRPQPQVRPVKRNHVLHRAILETYARYADHPHACEIHRWARDELARIESAASTSHNIRPETSRDTGAVVAADSQSDLFA